MQTQDAVVPLLLLAVVAGLFYAFGLPGLEAFRQPDDRDSSRALERGRIHYVLRCASCHGRTADGTSAGPALAGATDGPQVARHGHAIRPPETSLHLERLTGEARAALNAYLGHITGPAPQP